jgi:hypothetical protein
VPPLLALLTLANPTHVEGQGTTTASVPPRSRVAIVHATIYTMTDSVPIRDGTIVIDGGHITGVGARSSVTIPANARVIDASGKFVIPGLWDMHVHTAVPGGEGLLPLYIANGVTGVRDMGGDFATIKAWRKRIRDGSLVGPRIVASGPYIQGGDAALPHFVVTTPEQARAAVDSLASLGVDFVKLHEMVPRDAFFALARAARARGLPLGGHIARDVTVEEAADSGQRSLEHLAGFASFCSPADSVRLGAAHVLHRIVLGECSTSDQTPVYRHIARNRTWVTPTFVAGEMIASLPGPPPTDSLSRYEPKMLRDAMAAALEIPADMPGDADVLGRALLAKRLDVVRGLAGSGVPLLAGTDAPLPNSIPGFGIHFELEWLVRAGLSPWQALSAATVEPARYFAVDSVGSIRAGSVADLVVLDADPLLQIGNTRRIALVVSDGRVYSAKSRAALLEQALRAAGSSSPKKP